ncbi:MAG: phage tail protein [Deltaproteobacteria bacterium]|jgi:phage protein U|nr:phage tail protein [Deltaproteobacteria bacterium]
MRIGSLGDVVFSVSNTDLFTIEGLSRGRSVSLAAHSVMAGLPKLQHLGREPDSLSFSVILHQSLWRAKPAMLRPSAEPPVAAFDIHAAPGARESVDSRLEKILRMADAGDEQPLVFGRRYWGLWVIKSAGVEHSQFHNGITLSARVGLELTEYN